MYRTIEITTMKKVQEPKGCRTCSGAEIKDEQGFG
jgi:hypothetical protein